MEDTLIYPAHYAYQFRVDLLNKKNERIIHPGIGEVETCYDYKKIVKLMVETHFSYCFIFLETAEESKKLHLQGILWSQHNYTNKFINKLKSKFFFKHRTVKNSLSITSAKRIKSLCSYVSKENKIFLSTLTEEKIKLFPTWRKKDKLNKTDFKRMLTKKIKEECDMGESPKDVALMIINTYWDHSMRQPARMDIIKYLGWFHPEYTARNYLENINIFPSNNYY